MGLAGRPPSVVDFCLGLDASVYAPSLLAVMAILKPIPDSATVQEVDSMFPWAGTRPDLQVHLKLLLNNFPERCFFS